MRKAFSFLGTTLSAVAILAITAVAVATVWSSLASVTSVVNGVLSNQRMVEVEKERTQQTKIEWTERTKQTQIEWDARTAIVRAKGDTTVKVERIQERSTFWYNIRLLMIVGGLVVLGRQLLNSRLEVQHG